MTAAAPRHMADKNASPNTLKFLTFIIEGVRYGLGVEQVVEIIGVQHITRVPDAAHFVRGVINLRGRVIPVIDVRARFGLNDREYDHRTCIIVARVGQADVGLIVDTVQEVLDIPTSDIEPVPAVSSHGTADVVAAMARAQDGVIVLLSLERLVNLS